MVSNLIRDRGRGPEIEGTRLTVYNLLPYFLDPSVTEAYICRVCGLTPDEVAAARAYVLNHADTVLAEHLKIEAEMAAGNPPEVVERAEQTHATFLSFKQWLADRERAVAEEQLGVAAGSGNGTTAARPFPTFREWLAEQESRSVGGP